ncbi:MAG: LysR substrate-binding domain-containing protein [Pseudomonadota bacterium]|nr:LysR substrate-binding domain-containing protein [Pseudomonadota bacterium]MEC8039307.1 LysR substrate-binding domain-containing protein [Pseudomonadota bacterium]MEC8295347.1 LysR substrate-binding domain-containing protein [Pseudomonadota bacterium]
MQIPNLNNLRAFEAAARHLNFRLAAEELLVTQGAVAQQIRRLEQDLGTQLFHREARGVSLTEAGRRLQPNASQAIQLLHQGLLHLREGATVTLSVPPSFATKWLLPRLPDLAKDHPAITLNLRAEERVADLAQGMADLAVRLGPPPQDRGLTSIELAPLRLVAVAQPGLFDPQTALSGFSDLPLIQDGHRDWQRLMNAAGVAHGGAMLQVNQTGLALDAALQGQGIALVPDLYLPELLAAQLITPLWFAPQDDADVSASGFHLVWSPRHDRAEIATVRNWLKDVATGTGSDR